MPNYTTPPLAKSRRCTAPVGGVQEKPFVTSCHEELYEVDRAGIEPATPGFSSETVFASRLSTRTYDASFATVDIL
jgi:hypothetical protein